jgi:GR25 family glycosyltransferase involved in LPS biosynthesis
VPVAIVAHPRRITYAQSLAIVTQAEALCLDDEQYGGTGNHLRAWSWLAEGNCPWSVVIEDDAVPCPDFRRQLHAVLQKAPAPIVSLYLGRERPPHWQSSIARAISPPYSDPHFLTTTDLLHAVGYAIRTDLLDDMLSWTAPFESTMLIDNLITAWARARHHQIAYSRPSIFNHRTDLIPVVTDHQDDDERLLPRTAWIFGTRKYWESTTAEIPLPEQLGGPVFHARSHVG